MVTVTLYSRPGCSLCEEARALLVRLGQALPFELVEVDISRDWALREAYRFDIPVLFINGERVGHHRFVPEVLEQQLRAAGGTPVAEPSGTE
jgi:glutaredoxin